MLYRQAFSIGGACKRREAALKDYGSNKAHDRAIYFAARDWLKDTDATMAKEARVRLRKLLDASLSMRRSSQRGWRCRETNSTPQKLTAPHTNEDQTIQLWFVIPSSTLSDPFAQVSVRKPNPLTGVE